MNTKFTKGPWLKCSRGESLIGIEGKNVSVYNCGLSGSGKSPESVANAHLIAAAPDMYAEIQSDIEKLKASLDVDGLGSMFYLDIKVIIEHKELLLTKARRIT